MSPTADIPRCTRWSAMGPGCMKTPRGITAPGILRLVVTLRAKKRKNSSSARCHDQIRFRFHTAWATCRLTQCSERRHKREPSFPYNHHCDKVCRPTARKNCDDGTSSRGFGGALVWPLAARAQDDRRVKIQGRKTMRLQVLIIISALAFWLAGPRSLNAAPFGVYGGGPGSLISVCQPQCGVRNGHVGLVPPEARKCVFKCIAAKRAAQH